MLFPGKVTRTVRVRGKTVPNKAPLQEIIPGSFPSAIENGDSRYPNWIEGVKSGRAVAHTREAPVIPHLREGLQHSFMIMGSRRGAPAINTLRLGGISTNNLFISPPGNDDPFGK